MSMKSWLSNILYCIHSVIIMAQQQHAADVHPDELCPPNKRYDLMDANKKVDLDHMQSSIGIYNGVKDTIEFQDYWSSAAMANVMQISPKCLTTLSQDGYPTALDDEKGKNENDLQDTLQVSLAEHKSREEQEAKENVALRFAENLASERNRKDVNVTENKKKITDEVYELKRREKWKIKLQELTDTHTTPSSSSSHTKLSKTNRLLSLFKTKSTHFKRYTSFFQEVHRRYGYLFAHLQARFMPRKSFDTLSDNLHDVMVETLPAMVDKHIKEQVMKQNEKYSGSNLEPRIEIAIGPMSFPISRLNEQSFITEIIERRANKYLVSITEPDYKNLNKNDIEDIYLLIMNGKKVNLTAPIINFPGIEEHEMFSIIYEPVHGIIYKNSKKEKRVDEPFRNPSFDDATLNRVLEGLKSYNNDVKYGYVQKDLTKDETEYVKLFEEEIEERLKHRRQMRRWEMFVNRRPLGSRRERPE
ncbi:hypothetical protein Tco_1361641 [Tanacetum coccineum]